MSIDGTQQDELTHGHPLPTTTSAYVNAVEMMGLFAAFVQREFPDKAPVIAELLPPFSRYLAIELN